MTIDASAFDTYRLGCTPVVVTPPELDITNADQLRAAILAADGAQALLVDMSGTTFCDSRSVNVLVRQSQRMARQGRELRLVVATPPVQRILSTLGVNDVIKIFPSLTRAADGVWD